MNTLKQEVPIQEVPPTKGTLIDEMYRPADYRDAFRITRGAENDPSIADVASAYFLNQPRWLSLVSMNLLSRKRLIAAVGDKSYPEGGSVGSWKIHRRSENEIVFGDDMGFMEYRFSLLKRPDGDIEASTAVQYRWRRASHFYFTLVKPMHRRFVPISLRAALRPTQSGLTA